MLRRLLVLGAICSIAACFPKGWPPDGSRFGAEDTKVRAGPYVLLSEYGTPTVQVLADDDAEPRLEWWTAGSDHQRVDMIQDGDLFHAAIEARSGTMQYQIVAGGGFSEARRVQLPRARGERFRFAAFGDTRTGHDVHRALIDQMSTEKIDFVIHSGDLVEFGGRRDQWELFFQIEHPLISRVPLFAAAGNHDVSPRGMFRHYFLLDQTNDGRRYLYRDWGDVRVLLMDSEIEGRRGSAQYEFLDAALAEGAAEGMLMIMSLHYPPYSSGNHGSFMEWREVLSELAPRHGVELVLAGHDHNYERTKRIGGVTYMVAASGGANIRAIARSEFSEVLRTEPHYVLFDVDRGSLVGRTVNLAGDVFDEFVIPPNPPATGR